MTNQQAQDARGLELSGVNSEGAAVFDDIINDTYYYRLGGQDRLDALLSEQPTFGMGHVYKGYSLMSEGVTATRDKALERLELARGLAATLRERLHQEALAGWIDQDWNRCGRAWEDILVSWPLDLLAFRQHTGNLFWLGEKRRQAQVAAAAASHWDKGVPGWHHFCSAYAFAMEEIGAFDAAEEAARTALAIEPQDLWALHGMAHILEMTGRQREGIAALEASKDFFKDYNLFRGHLWWHLALLKFSEGSFEEALSLFDTEIYPGPSSFYLDIQNGVSLLLRLELQGIEVGSERWQRLAEGSRPTAMQNTIWFTTAHQVLAFLQVGDQGTVAETIAYAQGRGRAGDKRAEVAARISQALVAAADEQPRTALDILQPLREDFMMLGASHLQQDLYQQLLVSTALEAEDWPRVRQLLKERIYVRNWNPAYLKDAATRARQIEGIATQEELRAELRK